MSKEVLEVNNVVAVQTKLQDMLGLQQDLNDYTNGLGWESGINKHNKEINWFRCINLEVAEAIESTPWKHWKAVNGKVDWNNMQTELTDIWHFILSQLLVQYKNDTTSDRSQISLDLLSCYVTTADNIDCFEDTEFKALVSSLERIQFLSLLSNKEDREYFDISTSTNELLGLMVKEFFKTCKYANLSFDELHSMYIMKATLNKFRQDNGYAAGTYVKIWDGKEDNVICKDLWNMLSSENKSSQSLYSSLSVMYATLDM
jgi:dimeric dUTPase (all-alpha-NTP-PPase superfamily)